MALLAYWVADSLGFSLCFSSLDSDMLSFSGFELVPSYGSPTTPISKHEEIVATFAALRWDTHQREDPTWFSPTLDDLHDPYLMHGMREVVHRLKAALASNQRIRIITDYDVDGTTSSLVLQATLRILNPTVSLDYHIPNRFVEGYGFSTIAAQKAVDDGIDLIITADIGIRDQAAVDIARGGGVDVFILDHHLPDGADVPQGALVLCPPQNACTYPNPGLCACGVSLKLAHALLAHHPKFNAIFQSMLKLAAIGTVADMVPLNTRENRAIVILGLEALNNGTHNAGLEALLDLSKTKRGDIDEGTIGYQIGPRINAAGRMADANIVVELLNTRNPCTPKTTQPESRRSIRNAAKCKPNSWSKHSSKYNIQNPLLPSFVVLKKTGGTEVSWVLWPQN